MNVNASSGTVHVVDDEAVVRDAVDWTLRSVGYDVQVHASAAEFLAALDPRVPTCAIVDLLLPGMTGLSLCRELRARQGHCAFLMISGHADVASAVEAMKCGAVDFLEKPCGRQALLDAVHRAITLATRQEREVREEEEAAAKVRTLSHRELEVFEAVCKGLVTKEIATALGISHKTVDVHRSKIMQKLALESPTQIAHLEFLIRRRQQRIEALATKG